MLTASTALLAEITSLSQSPRQKTTIDRDRSGSPIDISSYAKAITVQRTLDTDLPDGTRLVNGYGAATATIDLAGDKTDNSHDGAWTFAPTNSASPWYGTRRIAAPVAVTMGFQKADGSNGLLPRFTGWTGTLNTDAGDRTGQLLCVDGAARLRTKVTLPLATRIGHPSLDGRYFIDYILTANGIDPATCDLEPSLNPLIATPYTGDKDEAWTLIQQIAAAELGTAFFDEGGKFHFWNRQHFTDQVVDFSAMTVTANGVTSPIPTVTTARALKTLTFVETDQSIRNHVVVNYTPYVVQPYSWVWQYTGNRGLHSKETITIWATFDNPVQSIAPDFIVLPLGGDNDGHNAYRACVNNDVSTDVFGTGVTNLTFTLTTFATSAKIQIHNPNGHTAFLKCPTLDAAGNPYPDESIGQPTLMLWGRSIIDSSSGVTAATTTSGSSGTFAEATDTASMNPVTGMGEQLLTIDGGNWIQDADTAQDLADFLLKLLHRPTPYLGDVDVVADPRLQLGDRIVLTDNSGTGMNSHAWIVGISETFAAESGDNYAQSLTLRMCNPPGAWIMGHPTRSVLGSTTILSGVY